MNAVDKNEYMLLKLIQYVPEKLPSDDQILQMIFDLQKTKNYALKYLATDEKIGQGETYEVDRRYDEIIALLEELACFRREVVDCLKD